MSAHSGNNMTRIRLTIVVPPPSTKADGEGTRFALSVSRDDPLGLVCAQIEQRYTANYLDAQQTFTIEKLQDAYDCDLDLRDTVDDMFGGETDTARRVIRVVPSLGDRECSVPPTSYLRPVNAPKRQRESEVEPVSKRQRLQLSSHESTLQPATKLIHFVPYKWPDKTATRSSPRVVVAANKNSKARMDTNKTSKAKGTAKNPSSFKPAAKQTPTIRFTTISSPKVVISASKSPRAQKQAVEQPKMSPVTRRAPRFLSHSPTPEVPLSDHEKEESDGESENLNDNESESESERENGRSGGDDYDEDSGGSSESVGNQSDTDEEDTKLLGEPNGMNEVDEASELDEEDIKMPGKPDETNRMEEPEERDVVDEESEEPEEPNEPAEPDVLEKHGDPDESGELDDPDKPEELDEPNVPDEQDEPTEPTPIPTVDEHVERLPSSPLSVLSWSPRMPSPKTRSPSPMPHIISPNTRKPSPPKNVAPSPQRISSSPKSLSSSVKSISSLATQLLSPRPHPLNPTPRVPSSLTHVASPPARTTIPPARILSSPPSVGSPPMRSTILCRTNGAPNGTVEAHETSQFAVPQSTPRRTPVPLPVNARLTSDPLSTQKGTPRPFNRYTGFKTLSEQLADVRSNTASSKQKTYDPRTMNLSKLAGKGKQVLGLEESSDDDSSSTSTSSSDSD